MKSQKKLMMIILSTILTLTACGSNNDSTISTDNTTVTKETTTTTSVENFVEDTQTVSEEEIEVIETTEESEIIQEEISQIIYDDNNIKITYMGLEEDLFGINMKLLIENNSDTDYTIQTKNFSVNGFMVDPVFSCEVASGKKANDSITLMNLEDIGINSIGNVEFMFNIFDSETWDNYLPCDIISLDIGEVQEPSFENGQVIYDSNDIKVTYLEYSEDSIMPGFKLLIENNSSTDITVQARDFSVNGFMIDPSFSAEVCANKKIVDEISIFESDLENNSIDLVENFEVSLHIFDSETWDTIVDTEPIIVDVQ